MIVLPPPSRHGCASGMGFTIVGGFRLRWTRVFAVAWRRHPPVGVTGDVHDTEYPEKSAMAAKSPFRSGNWDRALGSYLAVTQNSDKVCLSCECPSGVSVSQYGYCRGARYPQHTPQPARTGAGGGPGAAARTKTTIPRRGYGKSALWCSSNIHCVFYGTTATGKKCTVSRVRLVVTRRRSIGRPHRPVKFLPDFYPGYPTSKSPYSKPYSTCKSTWNHQSRSRQSNQRRLSQSVSQVGP